MRFGQGAQRGDGGPSPGRPESHACAAGRSAAGGNRARVCRARRAAAVDRDLRGDAGLHDGSRPPRADPTRARSRNWWRTAGRWKQASTLPSTPHTWRRPPGPRSWSSPDRCPTVRRLRSIATSSACTPCPMVLDFRGAGLLSVLDLKPYVVKPNRGVGADVGPHRSTTTPNCWPPMRELNRLAANGWW